MTTRAVRSRSPGPHDVESVIAGLTHDVRGALSVVNMGARLAREKLGNGDTEGAIEVVSRLDAAVVKAGNLCDDLLECCRRRARGTLDDSSLAQVDLVDAVRRCVVEHSALFETARCDVALHLPESAVLRAHRTSIDRVLANLVRNATFYGSGNLIEIQVQSLRHGILTVVRDHGAGIPGDAVRKLFAPFGGDDRDDRRFNHFGLGLWIVRNLVNSMRGCVYVATETGRGTAVSFVLPHFRSDHEGANGSRAHFSP